MNYYWSNRQKILQKKTKEKYSKEKLLNIIKKNKEAIKEKSREHYKNLSREEKDKIKEYQYTYIYIYHYIYIYIKNWFNIKKKR